MALTPEQTQALAALLDEMADTPTPEPAPQPKKAKTPSPKTTKAKASTPRTPAPDATPSERWKLESNEPAHTVKKADGTDSPRRAKIVWTEHEKGGIRLQIYGPDHATIAAMADAALEAAEALDG